MGLEWDLGRVSYYYFFNSSVGQPGLGNGDLISSQWLKFSVINTFEKLKKVMDIFLGGGRCSSRKKFAYSVRQSDYLSLKAIGDHPVKNDGSPYCCNLIYKCHENSLWGLTCTPPVMGSSLPLEKASPFLQALVFSKVLLVVSRTQSPLLTSSFLQHPQLSPANPTFVL